MTAKRSTFIGLIANYVSQRTFGKTSQMRIVTFSCDQLTFDVWTYKDLETYSQLFCLLSYS